MYKLPEKDRAAFNRALAEMNAAYDDEWKCPRLYLDKANYHTRLACQNVHSTFKAFVYGVTLLATGDAADLARAEEVLSHAAKLQDKDPTNATYGIWSWYMEESLTEMAPPDWNWADFCGKEILQALAFHRERLSPSLVDELEDALRHACRSIFRRNMHSGYTNISIMGAYVTMHAGKLLGWDFMFDYGRRRLEKFAELTNTFGTFAEYNSATYTRVAIEELTRIRDNVDDREVRSLADDMLDVAWRTVAEHFHAPTKQWCGPNARSYTWLAAPDILSFLEYASDHRVSLLSDPADFVYDPSWAYSDVRCPEKYLEAFTRCVPHDINIGFSTGSKPTDPRDSIAMMHMENDYVLSSWALSSTWNQRRNLLGFWGGARPRFVSATILHDLYDFSSGMYSSAQKDGHALALASFVSDGGDTHCNLDMIKDETIRAYDLRARIEIGGAYESAPVLNGDTATLADGGITLRVKLVGAEFDGEKLPLTLSDSDADRLIQDSKTDLHRRFVGDEKRAYIDVVFYHGEEREFKLSALRSAFAAFYVSLDGADCENASVSTDGGFVRASVGALGHSLAVTSPVRPVPTKVFKSVCEIDGVSLNKTYGLPE